MACCWSMAGSTWDAGRGGEGQRPPSHDLHAHYTTHCPHPTACLPQHWIPI